MFMEEIGDMKMEEKKRIMRVMKKGEYMKVGGRKKIKKDVRIVEEKKRDLRKIIEKGILREEI